MPDKQSFSSKDYWEKRYSEGGNSGAGSYDKLADFKAEVLNQFVSENKIQTVTELGVGDGNQLRLAEYPHYLGLDVSKTSINMCRAIFAGDSSKHFELMGKPTDFLKKKSWISELTVSLDVIFHLIEDTVFDKYMISLFNLSSKYVIIYSSNGSIKAEKAVHVKDRKFTKWVEKNLPNWKLMDTIKNRYPLNPGVKPNIDTSRSDFYFYQLEESE